MRLSSELHEMWSPANLFCRISCVLEERENCIYMLNKDNIIIDTLYINVFEILLFLQLAGDYLIENLAVHNVCECLQASIVWTQDELKAASIKFIEQHTEVRNNADTTKT